MLRRPWGNHVAREDLKVGLARQGNESLSGRCILGAQLPSVRGTAYLGSGCCDVGMGSLGS